MISLGAIGASAALCLATQVQADSIRCQMADGVALAFDIDRTQFAPAVDSNEPPRRKVTLVRMGEAQFPAEPFIIGDLRGFSAEGLGGSEMLFLVEADGSARLVNDRAGTLVEGTCIG